MLEGRFCGGVRRGGLDIETRRQAGASWGRRRGRIWWNSPRAGGAGEAIDFFLLFLVVSGMFFVVLGCCSVSSNHITDMLFRREFSRWSVGSVLKGGSYVGQKRPFPCVCVWVSVRVYDRWCFGDIIFLLQSWSTWATLPVMYRQHLTVSEPITSSFLIDQHTVIYIVAGCAYCRFAVGP